VRRFTLLGGRKGLKESNSDLGGTFFLMDGAHDWGTLNNLKKAENFLHQMNESSREEKGQDRQLNV